MLLRLIALVNKVNYMRRSSIICRHADHYPIMGQPQSNCLTGDTQVTKFITHRSSHDIEAVPFTSYPTKTSHALNVFCRSGMKRLLSTYCSALKALRENIDRIYKITMKISSGWSNQVDLGAFTISLIFTRSIILTIAIGTSEKTATHELDKLVQYLRVCTVSLDGDSNWYGHVVCPTEKKYGPIYNHHDAINSYRSLTMHQSIHRIWTDCKTLNKAYISLYVHPDQKAKYDCSGTTVRK